MRLLDGRRVQVKDLLDEGFLEPGAVLVFNRPRSGECYRAEVTDAGRLRLTDGREFAAPSRAAMEAADVGAIDGWSAWTLQDTDTTLIELRQQLLDKASVASRDHDSGTEHSPEERHRQLTLARAAATGGQPQRLTVRQLLALWGAKGRGHRVLDRVSAELENYSLETHPDFRKVTLDSHVALVAQATGQEAEQDEDAESSSESSVREDLDVGLTLGNVPSALNGITSVTPGDSLQTAMTMMVLDDYSQLAVMPTSRTLHGAVTWRSIAKAIAVDPQATLADAIEQAREHSYDRDLIDVLPELYRHDFVFVRNSVREISGIVTAADVVDLYGETATPFFIIGEIDHLLRGFVADEWTLEQVKEVCDPDGERTDLLSHDDLTFGDYERMIEEPGRFAALQWPLDRVVFIKRLKRVRELRNAVTHFDPDPLDDDAVNVLRNFLYMLRELRKRAVQ
jgi:CBS domain-containing protein